MSYKSIALVLGGLLLGCGAGATVGATSALEPMESGPGNWTCYHAPDFPDVAKAAGKVEDRTQALREIAPDSPKGTIVVEGTLFCAVK